MFQSTHSLRSATNYGSPRWNQVPVSIHALLAECDPELDWPIDILSSFNPRTPCGVRPFWNSSLFQRLRFQSTHSLRSATKGSSVPSSLNGSFNPRTPCGVRRSPDDILLHDLLFQSTHSLRSATFQAFVAAKDFIVSIHALLAECDELGAQTDNLTGVSIHALLAECDCRMLRGLHQDPVSIHALLAECDRICLHSGARGCVSIHALLAECDHGNTLSESRRSLFQSTHSLRSATKASLFLGPRILVSIHALLAECDRRTTTMMTRTRTFQSTHSLRSATPGDAILLGFERFQSTHSLRSATCRRGFPLGKVTVSIHALLAECDGL